MTSDNPSLGRNLPELLTLEEAAVWARVSVSTISDWIGGKHPEVASFGKGRNRSVSRDSLVEFVKLNTLNPRRPEWLTPQLVSDMERQLRELVAAEVAEQLARRAA